MSEKKDVYAEAKKQMRLGERIVAAIPGFRGYKEKELRRESDKLIRNHLHYKLYEHPIFYKMGIVSSLPASFWHNGQAGRQGLFPFPLQGLPTPI